MFVCDFLCVVWIYLGNFVFNCVCSVLMMVVQWCFWIRQLVRNSGSISSIGVIIGCIVISGNSSIDRIVMNQLYRLIICILCCCVLSMMCLCIIGKQCRLKFGVKFLWNVMLLLGSVWKVSCSYLFCGRLCFRLFSESWVCMVGDVVMCLLNRVMF